jgi:hypothetical protein
MRLMHGCAMLMNRTRMLGFKISLKKNGAP